MSLTETETMTGILRGKPGIVERVTMEQEKEDIIADFKKLDTAKSRREWINKLFAASKFNKEKRKNISESLKELRGSFQKLDKATDYVNQNSLSMSATKKEQKEEKENFQPYTPNQLVAISSPGKLSKIREKIVNDYDMSKPQIKDQIANDLYGIVPSRAPTNQPKAIEVLEPDDSVDLDANTRGGMKKEMEKEAKKVTLRVKKRKKGSASTAVALPSGDVSTAVANTRGAARRATQQQPRIGSASTATQPPPVMSPDSLTEEQERNIQSDSVRKAQKEMFDKLLRENPDFLPQSKSSKEQFKQTDVENVERTQITDIPNSRLASDFKTVKQLNDDIKYFFSNFGEALKDEQARYKSMSKTSKKLVLDMHKRIVAKLKAKSPDKKGENIGVVIDGKDYVKKMVNEILLTQSASKLRPDDLIINVTDPEQKRDKGLSDIGTYEVKGGRSIQREPIYQFIPTDNSDVYKESKKPNRITKLAMPKTKAETYQKEYKQNEFARPPKNKPVRLKYLY